MQSFSRKDQLAANVLAIWGARGFCVFIFFTSLLGGLKGQNVARGWFMNQPHATFCRNICDFGQAERYLTSWSRLWENKRVHVIRSGFMQEMLFLNTK
jgi:hypothetical protein